MPRMKKDVCGAVPARVSLALLTSLGVVVLYLIRINMSVTIVAMVKTVSHQNETDALQPHRKAYCLAQDSTSNVNMTMFEDEGKLDADAAFNLTQPDSQAEQDLDQLFLTSTQKGMVLSAFFYGYFISNIPGGRLAEEYGTKKVFGGSILISGLLTMLTPVATRVHYILLIALRVTIGLVNGVVYPALNVLIARWIPPLERSRFMSFTFMSNTFGTILSLPVCAVIADTLGWPFVFYITGAVSMVWVVVWVLLMHDYPEQHPRITTEEKNYILDAINAEKTGSKPCRTPWLQMLTSLPIWAIAVGHIGCMVGFNLLLTQLPTYMDTILGFSITSNGALSSLPFLSQFFGSTGAGILSDWLVTKGIISLHTSRRLFTLICLLLSGILIVVVGYVGCNATLAVVLLCLTCAFIGAMCSGYLANTQDLSTYYSGTILGITNTCAFAVSMSVPVVVGAMTSDQSLVEWQTVFWVTGIIQAASCLFFVVFSTTEKQPWNESTAEDEEKMRKGDCNDAKDKHELEKMLTEKEPPTSFTGSPKKA